MKAILKTFFIFIAVFVLAGAIMYLLFAFANYDLNAENWDSFDRGFSSFSAVVVAIFASVIYIFGHDKK